MMIHTRKVIRLGRATLARNIARNIALSLSLSSGARLRKLADCEYYRKYWQAGFLLVSRFAIITTTGEGERKVGERFYLFSTVDKQTERYPDTTRIL